jgi:hypothetical protein
MPRAGRIDPDPYPSSQTTLSVGGSITQSLIAAGIDPVDDQLTNDNGVIIGGASSFIKSVKVKGAVDNNSIFAAGAFPKKANIGGIKVDPLLDPRFDSTPWAFFGTAAHRLWPSDMGFADRAAGDSSPSF